MMRLFKKFDVNYIKIIFNKNKTSKEILELIKNYLNNDNIPLSNKMKNLFGKKIK